MLECDRVFLTAGEALEAVRIDIEGYGPQPEVYARVAGLFEGHGGGCAASREAVLGRLSGAAFGGAELAWLCAAVFDARCSPGSDGLGREGVWIATGMEDFACTRCGRCCLALDFHDECTEEDVRLWRQRGRDDILAWVVEEPGPGGEPQYRFWIDPVTGFYAETCPWLRRIPGDKAFVCAIQDVKPAICRSYPGLRKHARMTGCKGFGQD